MLDELRRLVVDLHVAGLVIAIALGISAIIAFALAAILRRLGR